MKGEVEDDVKLKQQTGLMFEELGFRVVEAEQQEEEREGNLLTRHIIIPIDTEMNWWEFGFSS